MISFAPRQTEDIENITAEHLYGYGQITSLLWRAEGLYGESLVRRQREEVHIPVNLGFYGIAYAADVPVGFFTYAMISDALQLALLRGEVFRLTNEKDWHSGDNVWIASAVSPYANAGLKMTRYIVENMPLSVRKARALRAYPASLAGEARRRARITEWYRRDKDNSVRIRLYSVDDLISTLSSI